MVLLEAAVDLTRADWTRTIQLESGDDGAFRGTVEQCFASLFTKKKFVPEGSDETDDDDVEPDATCDRID